MTPANFTIPLVIHLSSELRVESPGRPPVETAAFIAGLIDEVGAVEAEDFVGLQVDLTPVAAYRLTRGAIGRLAGTVAPLDDVLGPAGGRLVEQLGNTDGWGRRLSTLEAFLIDAIESGPSPSPEVVGTWEAVAERHGTIRVAELASDLGWSARHLRNRLRDQLGVSPKVLARLARFDHATRLLEQGARGDIGHLAIAAGYYDQAHFNNEWKRMAGRTPLEHRRVRGDATHADSSKRTIGASA